MTKVTGRIRHDVTFQCPTCGHIESLDMQYLPLDKTVDCDECDEELYIELEE